MTDLRSHGRRLGRRGTFLLSFAVVWGIIGLSTIVAPVPLSNQALFFEQLPLWVRAGLWIVGGLLALGAAFLRRPGWDVGGFVGLAVPAAVRGVSFLIGWIVYLTGLGPGSMIGWTGFAVYAAIVVAIMVVASWPEPPVVEIAHPETLPLGVPDD